MKSHNCQSGKRNNTGTKHHKCQELKNEEIIVKIPTGDVDWIGDTIADLWEVLTPDMVTRLENILIQDMHLTRHETDEFIRNLKEMRKKRGCFSNNNKIVRVGQRNRWIKEVSRNIADQLATFVVDILFAERTDRSKRLTEQILCHLCSLTGENATVQTANTRIEKTLLVVADCMAKWIDDGLTDIEKKKNCTYHKHSTPLKKCDDIVTSVISSDSDYDEAYPFYRGLPVIPVCFNSPAFESTSLYTKPQHEGVERQTSEQSVRVTSSVVKTPKEDAEEIESIAEEADEEETEEESSEQEETEEEEHEYDDDDDNDEEEEDEDDKDDSEFENNKGENIESDKKTLPTKETKGDKRQKSSETKDKIDKEIKEKEDKLNKDTKSPTGKSKKTKEKKDSENSVKSNKLKKASKDEAIKKHKQNKKKEKENITKKQSPRDNDKIITQNDSKEMVYNSDEEKESHEEDRENSDPDTELDEMVEKEDINFIVDNTVPYEADEELENEKVEKQSEEELQTEEEEEEIYDKEKKEAKIMEEIKKDKEEEDFIQKSKKQEEESTKSTSTSSLTMESVGLKPIFEDGLTGIFDLLKEDIKQLPKAEIKSERQKAVKKIVNERFKYIAKEKTKKSLDSLMTYDISEAASIAANWVENVLMSADIVPKPSPVTSLFRHSSAFEIKRVDDTNYKASKVSYRTITQRVAAVRGVDLETIKRQYVPQTLSPMNVKSTKDWADWAIGATNMGDKWGKWLDNKMAEIEKRLLDRGPRATLQGYHSWSDWKNEAAEEARKWIEDNRRLKNEGNLWNRKFQKQPAKINEKVIRNQSY